MNKVVIPVTSRSWAILVSGGWCTGITGRFLSFSLCFKRQCHRCGEQKIGGWIMNTIRWRCTGITVSNWFGWFGMFRIGWILSLTLFTLMLLLHRNKKKHTHKTYIAINWNAQRFQVINLLKQHENGAEMKLKMSF